MCQWGLISWHSSLVGKVGLMLSMFSFFVAHEVWIQNYRVFSLLGRFLRITSGSVTG